MKGGGICEGKKSVIVSGQTKGGLTDALVPEMPNGSQTKSEMRRDDETSSQKRETYSKAY